MMITLRELLDHAAEHNYAVPAFNVNNMEQILAIMRAADTMDAPVILQASRGARKYAGDVMVRKLVEAAVEMYPHIPVVLHQDHGNSLETCYSAIHNGFTSVMMDGSLEKDGKTPASFEYNVQITRRVVETAHAIGVSVEGELGCLGSLETGEGEAEDGHGAEGVLSKEALLTDPEQAAEFVALTGVDALAVAIGTSHGAYKFTREPDGGVLAMDVLGRIHRRNPDLHLVMHGSSSVPKDLQEAFKEAGGQMRPTWGVPVEEIVRGIDLGVRKVNIDTDCRLAMAVAMRSVAGTKTAEFDPRKFLQPAMDAMEALCASRYQSFRSAGKASSFRSVGVSGMARQYAAAVA